MVVGRWSLGEDRRVLPYHAAAVLRPVLRAGHFAACCQPAPAGLPHPVAGGHGCALRADGRVRRLPADHQPVCAAGGRPRLARGVQGDGAAGQRGDGRAGPHPPRSLRRLHGVGADGRRRGWRGGAGLRRQRAWAFGAQIYTHVHGQPVDDPRYDPFYARMADLGLLLQVHPCRTAAWPDYPTETRSKFEIWWTFGWEYDLSAFMARVVFAGVLERYPDLRFLIHHGGSMVPHFAGRVGPGWDQLGARTPDDQRADIEGYPLSKRPIDYFKQMYVDTAMFGAAHALRCVIDFYGADHVLFGSDSPFDPEGGPGYIRATIKNLQEIGLSEAEQ